MPIPPNSCVLQATSTKPHQLLLLSIVRGRFFVYHHFLRCLSSPEVNNSNSACTTRAKELCKMGATSSAVAPHNKFPDDLDVTRHVKRKIGRSITNDHANSSTHSALTADLTASPSISPSSSIVSERVARGSPAFGITGAFSNTVLFPARGNLDFHEDPDKFELHCILRDPFGLKIFHKFAFDGKKKKEGRNRTIFFCWQDCETFRTMPSRNYRLARARSLYKKYLSGKSGIPLVLPRTLQKDKGTVEDFENVLSVIEKLKGESGRGAEEGRREGRGGAKDGWGEAAAKAPHR